MLHSVHGRRVLDYFKSSSVPIATPLKQMELYKYRQSSILTVLKTYFQTYITDFRISLVQT